MCRFINWCREIYRGFYPMNIWHQRIDQIQMRPTAVEEPCFVGPFGIRGITSNFRINN